MRHRTPLTVIAIALSSMALAACGESAEAPSTPSSKLVPGPAGTPGQIILTAEGEQRIGLQTVSAKAAPKATSARVMIPFSAVVYAPDGRTYTFTNSAPLTFTEVAITVDHISGNSAYLRAGPSAGTRVVTVGAEELYGVQTGVLAQT